MNKLAAVVIGGSNGIGLSITSKLIKKGYFIYIVDRVEPDEKVLNKEKYCFIKTDLSDFDQRAFEVLEKNNNINTLIITAGYGRVARFENIDCYEIKKQMQVNAISIMQIIKIFYNKILSKENFYTGLMVSIAGRVSSPLFSTYSASKAALSKFIEALNIELEKGGSSNRILEISPGSLKGTKFNGGDNDLSQLDDITDDILRRIFNKETLFIPNYDTVYKDVIERYQKNSREFGLQSYDYKMMSGRIENSSRKVIGYLSGTFDLFHIGHLNLLKRAKEKCDYLIVGVHPSAAHKGKQTFIPFEERKAIVACCKYVDEVVDSCKEDSDAWEIYGYNKLFVGSDYKNTERFNNYEKYFEDKNVEIVYFPYTKTTSSTQIRNEINKEKIIKKD